MPDREFLYKVYKLSEFEFQVIKLWTLTFKFGGSGTCYVHACCSLPTHSCFNIAVRRERRLFPAMASNAVHPDNVNEVRETLRKIQKNLECPIWCVCVRVHVCVLCMDPSEESTL